MFEDDDDVDFSSETEEVTEKITKAKDKTFGKGPKVMCLANMAEQAEFLPTGIGEIDSKIGGIPRGCGTHLAGMTGAGKTTFIIQATIYALSTLDEKYNLGYCDFECRAWKSMFSYFCRIYGVDESRVFLFRPEYGEQGCDQIVEWVDDDSFAIIVADSLKNVTPKDSMMKKMEQNEAQQSQTKLLDRWSRTIAPRVRANNKALIMIDHLKKKQVNRFITKNETATGETVKFFCSARWFMLTRNALKKTISGEEVPVGRKVDLFVEKSTVADMTTIKGLTFIYKRGFSSFKYFMQKAIELKILKKDGADYLIAGKVSLPGNAKRLAEWLSDDKNRKVWNKVVAKVYDIEKKKFDANQRLDPNIYDLEFK